MLSNTEEQTSCTSSCWRLEITLSAFYPVNVLLELVLYPDFLNEASQLGEGCLKIFENLTRSLLSPPSNIQNLEAVIKKMEICGPNVTPSGLATLNSVWQVMATMASKLDSMADQGTKVIVTFNTALHLLHPPSGQQAQTDQFPTSVLCSGLSNSSHEKGL